MRKSRLLLGFLLLVSLPLSSCMRLPEAAPLASVDRSARWRAQEVSGLPATAEIADVVARDGVWVAVGSVQGGMVAYEPLDFGIWRSRDGLVWQEAFRTRAQGDESTTGHVTVTSDGFAVAGTTCRNQVCQPMALVSNDGRRWQPAARPPVGLDVGDSRQRGVISGIAGLLDEWGHPGRVLVAVGYAASQPGGGSAEAKPVVWRSGDAGRTWDADTPALAGPGHVYPLDRVETLRRTFVAHGSEEGADHLSHDVLWRSDDGGRQWNRITLPDGLDASSMPVTGHPRSALLLVGRRTTGEPVLWRSEDLVRWHELGTMPARDGSLVDMGGTLVFARTQGFSTNDRLELWGAPSGAARFDRTFFLGPKEQPEVEGMIALDHSAHVYAAVGRPGTRSFVRLSAGEVCAAAPCPGTTSVPADVTALVSYRADPVPVLSASQRVLVADDRTGFGRRWTDVTPERLLGSSKESMEDAVFVDRAHGWLVVKNVEDLGAWILRTSDGGRDWLTTSYQGGFSMHAGTSLKLATVGTDHGWAAYVVPPAGSTPSLARTADGGRTWSGVDTQIEERLGNAIRFIDAKHGFSAEDFGFSGVRGLFATDDGGVTWTEREVPLPDGVAREQARYGLPRFFGGRGVLPVGIVEPDQSQPARARVAFYRSEDAGVTWRLAGITQVATASSVQAIAAGPDVWWAADGSGSRVSVTADGGRSWEEHRPHDAAVLNLIDASDQAAAIASGTVGSISGLLVTHDGGSTWNPFTPDGAPTEPNPAPCANPGPPRLPEAATHVTVAKGDLDGDRHPDRLVFYTVPSNGRDYEQWRIRAELADGTVIDTGNDEWRSKERPVGALDLDGNARQEIFIVVEGPDSASVGAIVLRGCELSAVFGLGSPTVRYDKDERPGRATAGVTCADVDGDNHPEIVATTLGPESGQWSYTAYRVAGGYARIAGTASGREPAEPRPAGIPFSPGLHCPGLSA